MYQLFFIMLVFNVFGNPDEKGVKYYIEQGMAYHNQSVYDTALLYYDSALQLAVRNKDDVQIALTSKLKGTEFIFLNKNDSALLYLRTSKNVADKIGNDSIYSIASNNFGYALLQLGMVDSAKLNLYENLKRSEEKQDTISIAVTHHQLSILFKREGDNENGIENALKASYYFEILDETNYLMYAMNGLGNMYEALNQDDTAYYYYSRALNLSKKLGEKDFLYTILFNMAIIDFNRGNNSDDRGDSEMANRYYEKAEKVFLELFDRFTKQKDTLSLAECYQSLSKIYQVRGQYYKAINYANKSLIMASKIKHADSQISALISLGDTYLEMGELKQAERYYQESLKNAEDHGQILFVHNVYKILASIYAKNGKWKSANTNLRLYTLYHDSAVSVEREKQISSHKRNYKIRLLQEENKAKDAKNKLLNMQNQQFNYRFSILLIISLFVVVSLGGLLLFFWMRAKKNRIIAEQKIQKLEDEKKLMRARSVLIGQENERKRIAHDLHDGIGVLLSTASIQFSQVKVDPEDPETGDLFKRATKLLNEAGGEVRKISRNMMPGVLSKLGLRDALEDLFESVNDIEGVNTNLKINCRKERLPENTEIMIYRVVQELVNNTIKHAKASEITFEINRTQEYIRIVYSDNGIGFDKTKVIKGKGLGLNGIRSRIDFLNGKLSLQTGIGKGTHYEIEIPLSA